MEGTVDASRVADSYSAGKGNLSLPSTAALERIVEYYSSRTAAVIWIDTILKSSKAPYACRLPFSANLIPTLAYFPLATRY